jgi:hypothetical protein
MKKLGTHGFESSGDLRTDMCWDEML